MRDTVPVHSVRGFILSLFFSAILWSVAIFAAGVWLG